MNFDKSILVIGGANIDMFAKSIEELKFYDSNPGKIEFSFGGVGRNVAENLARLDQNVFLISVVGDDNYGKEILDYCKKLSIDVSNSLIVSNCISSFYLSILDSNNDMHVAISSMDIYKKLNVEFIKHKSDFIKEVNLIMLDANIDFDVMEYILNNFDKPFFLDCVSTTKAKRIKNLIHKFHTIKANKAEAEILSNMKIIDKYSLEKCASFFIEKGNKQIFITLGKEGVYYSNGFKKGKISNHNIKVKNTTGAGDAFAAGIIYSHFLDLDIDQACQNGIAASIITLKSSSTVNKKISKNEIEKIKKEKLWI